MQIFSLAFIISVLSMMFRMAVPLIFGTIGEAFAERSGILNLGIEGMMLMGASIGFLVGLKTGNLWFGVAAAAVTGLTLGIIMAFFTVTLGAQQHVAGIGMTIFGSGAAFYIYRLNVATPGGIPPTVEPFKALEIPLLKNIPIIGPVLFRQYSLVYIALILVIVTWFIFYKTTLGLKIRAVGENAKAADTAGINVFVVRYLCLAIAGMLTAVGGAWLTLAQTGMFLPYITAGRGWVCIALVVFGFWDPLRILIGSLLFGFIDAFQLSLQAIGFRIPYHLFLMMPYLFTIIALVFVARRAIYPAELLKPYKREA